MEWLDRLTSVMDTISNSSIEGVGISELSRRTDLSKGTIHRMMQSMLRHELVVQNPQSKKYILGPKTMLWGSNFLQSQDPLGLLNRYCDEISIKTGLYAYICRFHLDQVFCLYTHKPFDLMNKYFVHVGQRIPLHCSSSGKVFLAYTDHENARSLLQKETITAYTPFTIKSLEDLLQELNGVRKTGIGFCNQELEMGVTGISAPIFHETNKTKVSITIVGETTQIDQHKEKYINELKIISNKASEHLKSISLLSSIQL